MASKSPSVEVEVDDKVVRVSNPDRVYFPETGATKLDLVHYYLAVGDGIVGALRERPCMLHRFPKGLAGDKVHQKRLPAGAPPWVETVRLHFPRWNRTADEPCVTELGSVIWAVQLATVAGFQRHIPEGDDVVRERFDVLRHVVVRGAASARARLRCGRALAVKRIRAPNGLQVAVADAEDALEVFQAQLVLQRRQTRKARQKFNHIESQMALRHHLRHLADDDIHVASHHLGQFIAEDREGVHAVDTDGCVPRPDGRAPRLGWADSPRGQAGEGCPPGRDSGPPSVP